MTKQSPIISITVQPNHSHLAQKPFVQIREHQDGSQSRQATFSPTGNVDSQTYVYVGRRGRETYLYKRRKSPPPPAPDNDNDRKLQAPSLVDVTAPHH